MSYVREECSHLSGNCVLLLRDDLFAGLFQWAPFSLGGGETTPDPFNKALFGSLFIYLFFKFFFYLTRP